MEETNFVRPAHTAGVSIADAQPSESVSTSLAKVDKDKAANVSESRSEGSDGSVEAGIVRRPTKSFAQKLKLWQSADLEKPNRIGDMILRPLQYFSFPVIFFCGFYYGSSLVWFNVLNGTAALILSGQYGFSTSMVGVSYVAALLGAAVGAAYTGLLGNRFIIWKARRNGGILESEHRLWLMTPPIIILPAGLILWGVGAAHHVHWFGVIVGMFVVSGASSVSVQGMCTYCIESYRALSGEAIITVILVRNTLSFAVSYGLTAWIDNLGIQNAFIVAAFAAMVQCASVLVMIRYGKTLRQRSAGRYSRYVEQMAQAGMAH